MSQHFITARRVISPPTDLGFDDLLAGCSIKKITTQTSGQAGKMQEVDLQSKANKEQVTKTKAAVKDFFERLSKEDQASVLQRLKKGERVVFKFRQSTKKTVPSSDWAIVSLVKDMFQPPKLAPGVCVCVRTESGDMVLDFKEDPPEAPGIFAEARSQKLKPIKSSQSKKTKKTKEIDPKFKPFLPTVAPGKSFRVTGNVLKVPGDGDCQFFSTGIGVKMARVAIPAHSCLTKQDWTVEEFRAEVVQWMKDNYANHHRLQAVLGANGPETDRLEDEIGSLQNLIDNADGTDLSAYDLQQAKERLAECEQRKQMLADADGDAEGYWRQIARNGAWGGEAELYAVANMFHVRVVVLDNRSGRVQLTYEPQDGDVAGEIRVRYNGAHYDVFVPASL